MRQIALITVFLFTSSAFSREEFSGRVVAVADGDTITVLRDDKRQVKVRLYGIDCPEKAQAFGNRARQFAGALLHGKDVWVRHLDTDRYKRAVALVYVDGVCANEELLRAGLAWVYVQYCKAPDCVAWPALENAARENRLGLWTDPQPTPPWLWRKTKKGKTRQQPSPPSDHPRTQQPLRSTTKHQKTVSASRAFPQGPGE